jgi:hypothetical protein
MAPDSEVQYPVVLPPRIVWRRQLMWVTPTLHLYECGYYIVRNCEKTEETPDGCVVFRSFRCRMCGFELREDFVRMRTRGLSEFTRRPSSFTPRKIPGTYLC